VINCILIAFLLGILPSSDEPKPLYVAPVEEKRIYYETLKKFSFFESGDWSVK
jgi:hypothetical protein